MSLWSSIHNALTKNAPTRSDPVQPSDDSNWSSAAASAGNFIKSVSSRGSSGGSSGGGGGGYGGSSGPSSIEQQAANRLREIARYNADATTRQLNRQLSNYDIANRQNRALADVQLQQDRRKTSADRFEAQRDLQNSALGLLGSMNQAMNGSSVGNLMRMLEDRNDKDNNVYWAQHQVNQDQVENAYNDSLNQNVVAKNDAIANAEKALADIQGDLSANLNNINPDLYEAPANGSIGNRGVYDQNRVAENNARISGYVMPDNRRGAERNRLLGNDYYSRLINKFNGR